MAVAASRCSGTVNLGPQLLPVGRDDGHETALESNGKVPVAEPGEALNLAILFLEGQLEGLVIVLGSLEEQEGAAAHVHCEG